MTTTEDPAKKAAEEQQKNEQLALEALRYRTWCENLGQELQKHQELQKLSILCFDNMSMAYLEAKEQRRKLRDAGWSDEQIDSIGQLPNLPVHPTTILARFRR